LESFIELLDGLGVVGFMFVFFVDDDSAATANAKGCCEFVMG
jgi:hypothetical protein